MECEVLHYDTQRDSRWIRAKVIRRCGNQFICEVTGLPGTGSYHITEVRFG